LSKIITVTCRKFDSITKNKNAMKPITHLTISILMFLNISNSQTLDTTFGTNGIVVTDLTTQVDAIGDLVVRDNGKIVASGIGGNFIIITQYLADGTLDNSFGNNGKVVTNFRSSFQNGAFSPIAIQTDGKILLLCQNFIQNVNNFILTRYNANGTLDTSFGTNGIVNNSQFNGFGNSRNITDMDLLSDGKIIVTVSTYNNQILLYRFNSDGTLDLTFGLNGISSITVPVDYTYFNSIDTSINANGNIVLLTSISDSMYNDINFAIVQLNPDGIINNDFGNNGIVIGDLGTTQQDSPRNIRLQDNGKIIVSGFTTGSNGKFVVIQHNSDGTLDTTFNTTGVTSISTGGSYRTLVDLLLDSDGKIVVAGSVGDDFACMRLNGDGTIDASFGLNGLYKKDFGNSSYDYGTKICQQSDGKYVIGGYTSFFCSDRAFGLTRISSTESLNSDEFEINKIIKMYPNPTSSIINIESDFTINSIELYDMQGRLLETNLVQESNSIMDISRRSKGVYFLKIETQQGYKVEKSYKTVAVA
jgi:uncharacterized delta-60 repeat protein